MPPSPPIVLASASPRRKALLEQVGLRFTVQPPDVDEAHSPANLEPAGIVEALADRKAAQIAATHPDALVLGCDTLVFVDGQPLGKAADAREAVEFLRRLAGREHQVLSGLCARLGERRIVGHCDTTVRMRALSDAEIKDYVGTGEYEGKAGAYAIQGRGALLIQAIRGDYSNVVGLPLSLLYGFLREFGIEPFHMADR